MIKDLERKIVCFLAGINNAYKADEDREDTGIIELSEDMTEDFTAMLIAMFLYYKSHAEGDVDLIEFTHLLNKLAIQGIMNSKISEESKFNGLIPGKGSLCNIWRIKKIK